MKAAVFAAASLPLFWVAVRWGLGPDKRVELAAIFWAALFGFTIELRELVRRNRVDRRVEETSAFLRPAKLPDNDLRNPPIGGSARVRDDL